MEDDFVTLGSALPQCEDEEILSRKPVSIHDQVVRDEQGRIRFHGAFTGGFSAGYFNSVDTKEGWVPKNFKSSRSSRNQDKGAQKPEDFMDKEDFGEFGIAPKKLFTSTKYQGSAKHSWKAPYESTLFSLFSNSHLQHCIEPAKLTVGQKLLRRIGWRVAHVNTFEESEAADVFGCALPPKLIAKRSINKPSTNQQPETTCPIDFSIQNNQFGVGYKGLAPQIVTSTAGSSSQQNKSKGIKGQAFGVGALEEEDDDIYCGDNVSNYNTVLYMEDDETIPSPLKSPKVRKEKSAIDGFKRSLGNTIRIKVYPPPAISNDFKLNQGGLHQSLASISEDDSTKHKHRNFQPRDSFKRAEILGETPQIGSIFDLISEKDRLRIEEAKQKCGISKSENKEKHYDAENLESANTQINDQHGAHCDTKKSPELTPEPSVVENQQSDNMTEWEKDQKREKLAKVNHFSLSVMMGRFTKASQDDDDNNAIPEQKEKSEKEKAASNNMFGRLTREVTKWHPAKLLCVRFNIEDPYPESTIVGLPVQKHSKLSIFDVLSADDLTLREPQAPIMESVSGSKTIVKPEESIQVSKPLAILATIDLRPSSEDSENITLIPADAPEVENEGNKEEHNEAVDENDDDVKDVPPPSMDIFKAIFEDDEDDSNEDDESDDQQEPIKNEMTGDLYQLSSQPTTVLPDTIENDDKKDSVTSSKKKHKKEKHKKHKHSHKSKKSKRSKKTRNSESDDSSNESHPELSTQEKKILSKLRSIS